MKNKKYEKPNIIYDELKLEDITLVSMNEDNVLFEDIFITEEF